MGQIVAMIVSVVMAARFIMHMIVGRMMMHMRSRLGDAALGQ